MKVSVLGAGAWGTVLARLLHTGSHQVTLWGHNRERLEEIRRTGKNLPYLPEIALPLDWRVEPILDRAISNAECIVVAVPSKAFREVAQSLAGHGQVIVSVTKGIEYETGLTMCGILRQ